MSAKPASYQPRYSGKRSEAFWQRVSVLPPRYHDEVYALGCALQDLEARVLTALRHAEMHSVGAIATAQTRGRGR